MSSLSLLHFFVNILHLHYTILPSGFQALFKYAFYHFEINNSFITMCVGMSEIYILDSAKNFCIILQKLKNIMTLD